MITIRDWIPAVPTEEKCLAYVGENKAVSKQFLLTGEDWEAYRNWGFFLDMAFDLSSVTTREVFSRETTQQTENENVTRSDSTETERTSNSSRKQNESGESQSTQMDTGLVSETVTVPETDMIKTTHDTTLTESGSRSDEINVTELASENSGVETASNTTGTASSTVTKENHTVTQVVVACDYTTDIAPLEKTETEEGLLLTWTVLRQHTQLPGRLRAVVRAIGADGEIKKSDIMVFTVEPSVSASAAVEIPESEFVQMERRMAALCDESQGMYQQAKRMADNAALDAGYAREAASRAETDAVEAKDSAAAAQSALAEVQEKAMAVAQNADAAAADAQSTKRWCDDAGAAAYTAVRSASEATAAAAQAKASADAIAAADWRSYAANAIEGKAEGAIIRTADISPLEHPCLVTATASNSIPFPYAEDTKTEGGITFTVNADGSIRVDGSDTAYRRFAVTEGVPLSAGAYRLVAGGTVSTSGVVLFNSVAGATVSESPGSEPIDLLLAEDTVMSVAVMTKDGGVTVAPQILRTDLSAATVVDCGKNLLPLTYRGQISGDSGIVFTDNEDGSVTATGTAVKSAQFRLNTGNVYLPEGVYTASGGVSGTILQADGSYRYFTPTSPTFTLRAGECLYRLVLAVSEGETVNTTFYPMLEAGAVATAYVPQREAVACPVAADGTVTVTMTKETTLRSLQTDITLRCRYHRDTNVVVEALLARITALEKQEKEGA